MEQSDFLSKDYVYNEISVKSRIFRIRDNYVRYYLKCIYPRKDQTHEILTRDRLNLF